MYQNAELYCFKCHFVTKIKHGLPWQYVLGLHEVVEHCPQGYLCVVRCAENPNLCLRARTNALSEFSRKIIPGNLALTCLHPE